MRKLRAALFDLDGTLIDTEGQYTIFWGQISREYRPDVPGLEQMIKGSTLTRIYNEFFTEPEWQVDITRRLNDFERQMHYTFYPGSLDFVRNLRQHGVKCAVVTSSNHEKMKSLAMQVPDFGSLFDRVLTSEDFTASKPNPDCFLLGAKIFGCCLDECVVFEDAYTGLQAGMRSGIFTIGMATGHTPEELEGRCDHIFTSFEGLNYDKLTTIINNKK